MKWQVHTRWIPDDGPAAKERHGDWIPGYGPPEGRRRAEVRAKACKKKWPYYEFRALPVDPEKRAEVLSKHA